MNHNTIYKKSDKGKLTEKKYRSSEKGKIAHIKDILKFKEKQPEYYPQYNRKYLTERRLKIIELLGGKCKICNFSDWRALQIDHINGGGHKEYKGTDSPYIYYGKILKNPDKEKYQILCANCNWIKRYVNNETNIKKAG